MYEASETAQEFMRDRFIADAELNNVAEQIAERWVSELTLEDDEAGLAATSRAAAEIRERIKIRVAQVLTSELTRFDLANNGDVDFEQWMDQQ